MSGWTEAGQMFPCGACGAGIGEPCVTYRPVTRPPGRPAVFQHADRWWQVRDVLRLAGYEAELYEYRVARWGMYRLVEQLRGTVVGHVNTAQNTRSSWLVEQLDAILTKGDPNR